MKDDFNPEPHPDSFEDDLTRAFDELIEGLSSHASEASEGRVGEPETARGCPAPEDWVSLFCPEGRSTEVDRLLAHAAVCGLCAAHLHRLHGQPTAEESAQLEQLASSSPGWQRSMAAQLSKTPHQGQSKRNQRLYLWIGSGLAACMALAVTVGAWWHLATAPERMLAESYSRTRIFDLRMPGAGFSGVETESHLRGGTTGREPAQLLEARARIERHLENAPDDHHWLQLEARADVLEEKFDPAIDILDRLLAAGPVTSSLLLDDATAYFQRGTADNSENDRATALDSLRRADELAPDDPVVLFNEAVVMEDRGQVMNAVETWNRYLRFERDPNWLADGRRRLQALEQKLTRLKSHQSRMEQHLATPAAMRALAVDSATLETVDEELSSLLLPKLLAPAFPMTADRTRGSPPCPDQCQAARTLLQALAASLERHHQDPWLTRLLPSARSTLPSDQPSPDYLQAINALALAIEADVSGNFAADEKYALTAGVLFKKLGNRAGEDRAQVEASYAHQVSSDIPGCYKLAHSLLGRDPEFAWIQVQALTEDSVCDPAPGTGVEDYSGFQHTVSMAHQRGYAVLELRARNLLGMSPVENGDAEAAWHIYLANIRLFYGGDYPAFKLYSALSGLAELEQSTPRVHLDLLLHREVVGVIEQTPNRQLVPTERVYLAIAALRAGSTDEATEQMRVAEKELAANGGGAGVQGFLVESEIAMAGLYLEQHDLAAAGRMLDSAHRHMVGISNTYRVRDYAVALGELELAQGHLDTAEPMLRSAIQVAERAGSKGGPQTIVLAQRDRQLYGVLAGVWLAQGRPPEEVLALWERYRLRILGQPAPVCPNHGLACLKPKLTAALARLGNDQLLGQVVLPDSLLLYRATNGGVTWTAVPISRKQLQTVAEGLEREASSPATALASVEHASRSAGSVLLAQLQDDPASPDAQSLHRQLFLEPDPQLGNLPWPLVADAAGPIGLRYSLEESPSLLLNRRSRDLAPRATRSDSNNTGRPAPVVGRVSGKSLIVGASVAAGDQQRLPEVLKEARAVAHFGSNSNVLLAEEATRAKLTEHLETATSIHFAGHATERDGGMRLLLAPQKPSRLLTGNDAYLDSTLLRQHPPRLARLAVFSACSTGKKQVGWNHGMGDIVDTLASLGVPDVVATRWQIDSSSAVPMMDAFYSGLAEGLSVPQSLTAARQTLSRDPRYRHPYYWAAYYSSGWGDSDLRPIFHKDQ
jgi:CHAT domain-containing protein